MENTVRCRTCHYWLRGLRGRHCPECGSPFDPADPSTYLTRKSHARAIWFVIVGVLAMCVFALWAFAYLDWNLRILRL